MRVLLLAQSPTCPRHATATAPDFQGSQAQTGGHGQESPSRAVDPTFPDNETCERVLGDSSVLLSEIISHCSPSGRL
jgi:hypothetical protein